MGYGRALRLLFLTGLQGHARPKLLRTYMPTLPLKEPREMLQKWGEELEKILAGAVAGAQGQML